jgi:formylglycine-generating enzyme required for sulfatase activity
MITHINATPFIASAMLDAIFSLPDDGPIFIEPCMVDIPGTEFQMAKYETTVLEWSVFVRSAAHSSDEPGLRSESEIIPAGIYSHPISRVSWYDSKNYAKWLSSVMEVDVSLPSVELWQKAATGGESDRTFPWGDTFVENKCNTYELGVGGTLPVNFFEGKGDSPYGVVDMVGNVWEWTTDEA